MHLNNKYHRFMKIAFIIYPEVVVTNRSNGVRSQAITWGEGLRSKGHDVVYINNWDNYDWNNFDVIHFFGMGDWVYSVAKRISKINPNIIFSPIVDPDLHPNYLKYFFKYILSKIFSNKINFNSNNYAYSQVLSIFKVINVRSIAEKNYLETVYHIESNKIRITPLAFDDKLLNISFDYDNKENFCLHISSIYQKRKNVIRLIEAAKKYDFNLVLAGNTGSSEQFSVIREAIGNAKNIKVLGFISEEEKYSLYKRAKVFSLPSIQEGVGIVALDAALLGCEIVISNIPGPKEYYKGRCMEVNPLSIDEIGQAVESFLSDKKKYQPELSAMIRNNYSSASIIEKLEIMYDYATR